MTRLAPPEDEVKSSVEPVAGNYFVAVYPPFSAWNAHDAPALDSALEQSASGPLGIYVHVPFCQKKCDYCYYLSYVGEPAAAVNRYLEAVVHELELYAQRPAMQKRKVSFAYFGGGTPSTLTFDQVEFLGEGLRGLLDWRNVEEITFEVAPRSVRPEFLNALRELGVNRISMGVQSFDDGLLKTNGRIHLARDVVNAYYKIREAGFPWVNLDLMCGMIGETPEHWHHTIRETLKLSPESVTLYQTEMPYNTQMFRDWRANRLPSPVVSWETKRSRLYTGLHAFERAGYTVASAYNVVKNPSVHQFRYQDYLWSGADMLGLGVASFGYFQGVHFQNATTREDYYAAVEQEKLPVYRAYQLTDLDQFIREFVLQIKFGFVDVKHFYHKFGVDICEVLAVPLAELSSQGFLVFSEREVRLTRAGLIRIDRLLPRFYSPEFRNLPYTK